MKDYRITFDPLTRSARTLYFTALNAEQAYLVSRHTVPPCHYRQVEIRKGKDNEN